MWWIGPHCSKCTSKTTRSEQINWPDNLIPFCFVSDILIWLLWLVTWIFSKRKRIFDIICVKGNTLCFVNQHVYILPWLLLPQLPFPFISSLFCWSGNKVSQPQDTSQLYFPLSFICWRSNGTYKSLEKFNLFKHWSNS